MHRCPVPVDSGDHHYRCLSAGDNGTMMIRGRCAFRVDVSVGLGPLKRHRLSLKAAPRPSRLALSPTIYIVSPCAGAGRCRSNHLTQRPYAARTDQHPSKVKYPHARPEARSTNTKLTSGCAISGVTDGDCSPLINESAGADLPRLTTCALDLTRVVSKATGETATFRI
jgi:hypothetical protein